MDAYKKLITYNIKPSVQRIAIMNYLLTHSTHPSADEVYTKLGKSMPTLSKTTVYNTLELLSEHGAALMLTIDESKVFFDGDTSPHAHFLCKKCGKIYDLPIVPSIQEVMVMNSEGHVIDEVHLYYKGTCKKCLAK
jgi:Fur family ferric uptake transcriptional regulator/Fur family peroxide stress response transcriptional regulator